jgi:predicted PurR-regulated permease PerM
MVENNNNENKWLAQFFRALPVIATIFGVIIGVYAWIQKPVSELKTQTALLSQQIEQIKTNDLVHIKEDLTEIKDNLKTYQANEVEIEKKIERILTILEGK